MMVLLVHRVLLDPRVQLAQRGFRVLSAQRVHKVFKVFKDYLALRVHKVMSAVLAQPDFKVQPDLRD